MHRYLPLLFIPIIFTFGFDFYLSNYENKIINNLNAKKNTINVHHNFDHGFNSSIINELYSEKIIQNSDEKNIVKLRPKTKINFKEKHEEYSAVDFSNINDLYNSLHLISLEWKNEFSNKKVKFIETLLPLIAFENHKIFLERKKLLNIKDYLSLAKTLNNKDLIYLKKMCEKYNVATNNKHKIDIIRELLLNVNFIPNSIVLAQAVNESGWGTSRFAKDYNALFGQYTYDENHGVVPFQREKGKKHLIKNFPSIEKSVESYFHNINSHYAYKKFRKLRSKISDFENDFNIKILTNALDVYAADKSYVDTINSIIDTNKLNQFYLNVKNLLDS